MEEQAKDEVSKKNEINEIKGTILEHISKIRGSVDSLDELIKKEELNEEEISQAFDFADEIETESEEITGLLFDLRDSK